MQLAHAGDVVKGLGWCLSSGFMDFRVLGLQGLRLALLILGVRLEVVDFTNPRLHSCSSAHRSRNIARFMVSWLHKCQIGSGP